MFMLHVREEPATSVWFAIPTSPATFGIFDALPNEAGRPTSRAVSLPP
jgi:hypothetical protein